MAEQKNIDPSTWNEDNMKNWRYIHRYDGPDVSIMTQIIDIEKINYD